MSDDPIHSPLTDDPAEHDAWFRSEVEAGLRELEDPDVKLIDHAEVVARFRVTQTEWLRRAGGEPLDDCAIGEE